jgi:DNA topoisomerase I
MTKWVIVESPAKCQKIQGFLGAGWRVIATMGHIRALQPDLAAIGLDRDFNATYEWIKEKAKAIQQLKECIGAETIYLASDDDREGEGISYAVCLLLKLDPNTALRSVFHEITESAVKHAIANPRRLDMNRVHAQETRAILDMMIGFTISPLLWRMVGPALSAGRCQTPALRLVVEREDAIQNFTASSSWTLHAQWNHKGFTFPSILEDELEDEESAVNYMEQVHHILQGTVISNAIHPWKESAPPPLITSTLQQQASALFGINPKRTMQIAQQLYEAGHITYMRTDKAVLSEEAVKEGKEWILQNHGAAYVYDGKKKEKQDPTAQEAHEAIRPTHMEKPTIEAEALQQKIYQLIWRRAIQSLMSPIQGETCIIRTQIQGDTDFVWSSKWKRTTFPGWKAVGAVAALEDESEEEKESDWEKAVALSQGDPVEWKSIQAEPKETKAQGRYTEATLVRELEHFGIGRPSTFASLLSVIQEKQYVETKDIPAKEQKRKEYQLSPGRWPASIKEVLKKVGAEKKKLVPTALGRSVLEVLIQHFNDLFSYGFTAHMEKRLDAVSMGQGDAKQVLRDTWSSYKERYEALKQAAPIRSEKVRDFGKGLKAVQSKKGPLLLIETGKNTEFLGWPADITWEQMTEEIARGFQPNMMGEWNGQPIRKKSGSYGEYLQCGEISIAYQADESLEQVMVRLEQKKNGALRTFKNFVIRTGTYGPYIMKTSLKKPKFISLPKGLDPATLTEKEVEAIYKIGMDRKK